MMIAASQALIRAACAAPPQPLDAEFLDYLAACEGKDDNWTVVADDETRREPRKQAAPKKTPAAEPTKPKEDRP